MSRNEGIPDFNPLDYNSADYLPSSDDIGSFLSDVSQQVEGMSHDPGAARSAVHITQSPQARTMEFGAASQTTPQTNAKNQQTATNQGEGVRDVVQGQWTFRLYASNGRVKIVAGPSGVGTVYTPGTSEYATVIRNLLASGGSIASTVRSVIPNADNVASTAPAPAPAAASGGALTPDLYQPPVIPIYKRREVWVVGGTVAALAGLYYFGVFDKIANLFDRD